MHKRQRTRYQKARSLAQPEHNVRTDEPTTAIQTAIEAFGTDIHGLAKLIGVYTDELVADHPHILVLQSLMRHVNIKLGAFMEARDQLARALRHHEQRQMIQRMRVQKR